MTHSYPIISFDADTIVVARVNNTVSVMTNNRAHPLFVYNKLPCIKVDDVAHQVCLEKKVDDTVHQLTPAEVVSVLYAKLGVDISPKVRAAMKENAPTIIGTSAGPPRAVGIGPAPLPIGIGPAPTRAVGTGPAPQRAVGVGPAPARAVGIGPAPQPVGIGLAPTRVVGFRPAPQPIGIGNGPFIIGTSAGIGFAAPFPNTANISGNTHLQTLKTPSIFPSAFNNI